MGSGKKAEAVVFYEPLNFQEQFKILNFNLSRGTQVAQPFLYSVISYRNIHNYFCTVINICKDWDLKGEPVGEEIEKLVI